MAISAEAGILAMLKTYYAKEGLQNLLYRNDPLLKKIKKVRVEGKQQNFSALYSRGGAVSANFLTAKRLATESAKAKEFQVTPGQIFSGCVFNAKEISASKTARGAYINVASAKFFANAESFRKTLAVALYGSGHGELFTYGASATDTIPASQAIGATVSFTFPRYAIMGIDIGSELEIKTSAAATSAVNTLTVVSIDGLTVKAKISTATTTAVSLASDVVCLSGCTDGSGKPLLPIGLAGWIPSGNVSGADNFFGVNRSEARDRLAGSVVDNSSSSSSTKYGTIQEGILALRRMGSLADMIVLNDEDYLALQKEVEAKTNFLKTAGTGKTAKTGLGYEGFGISVSSNWLDNVIDSPYCPKGTAYILDSEAVELWTYTNADKIADGVVNNEPGKADVQADGEVANRPYQLLVDDLFSVTPGTDTSDGAAALVTLNFFGSFAVTNPSVCGVVKFYES